nr:GNAT family N-acetyltransferase [uncultured Desulfobacter sp.]
MDAKKALQLTGRTCHYTMKTNDTYFNLRKATFDDIEFIFQLRIQTMKKDFDNTLGWHEGEQRRRAADEIQHAQIIMMNQTDIGVIKVIPRTKKLHLHQMQILPEYQGRGIGSKLVSQVLDCAKNKKIPVTLLVLKGAAAKRIYDRFGFSVINEYENNYMMRWQPKSLYENDVV